MISAGTILWNVVEEHLDEAEFLLEQWLGASRSPRFTLVQLQKTVEHRLIAHLDGLAVGGQEVADKLLWPALDKESDAPPSRVAAAALALLLEPATSVRDRLIELFRTSDSKIIRAGLRRAFELSERTDLDEPVRLALYATDAPATQAALLEVLAARRVDPGPILGHLLQNSDLDVMVAALHAATAADPGPHQYLVADLLAAKEPRIREAALRTALIWNLASGWTTCIAEARAGGRAAMLSVATLGGPGELALLTSALRLTEQRSAALFALGFSGWSEAVEACLPFLDDADAKIAKLAAEAVAAITDLPINEKPFALPPAADVGDEQLPPLEEDLSADLTPDPADDLPLVDAAQVRTWWAERKSSYKAGARYLRGKPLSSASAGAALAEASLRRFEPLAFEISVRAGGQPQAPALRPRYRKPEVATSLAFTRQPRWR
jgi:uncharacterized protein (TIGR02270 family)